MTAEFTAILTPAEEGGFVIECAEIPGALSQGETRIEALENLADAIALILDSNRDDAVCQAEPSATTDTIKVDLNEASRIVETLA